MKKVLVFLFICSFCLVCTGCTGSITRHIRQDGYSLSEKKFVCSTLMPAKKKLFSKEEKPTTEKIKFIDSNYVVSENGNLYEISLSGLYSNNMNCKKTASDIKVASMIDNEILKGEDGRYYYLGASSDTVIKYSEVPKEDQNLDIYNLILGDSNVVKAMLVNSNTHSYYVLKKNGNIYNYVLKQDDTTKKYSILSDNIVYRSADFDSDIVDFKYYGESSSTYFRTKKSIYRMMYTNQKECSKYVDVPCTYKLQKDTVLTENQDRMIGYGGTVVIMDYGRMFTVGS